MVLLNGYVYLGIVLRKETAMKKSGKFRLSLILIVITTVFICASSISFAATSVKKVNYKGGGKVEISFSSKVTYSSPKVAVTDNNGTTYGASIVKKGSTSLQFKISKYKTGKTYKVKISGIKGGGAVTSFKIVSKKAAIATAKGKAKSTWGAKSFTNIEVESTTYKSTGVWKVSFAAGGFNYTYWISQQTGNLLRSERK